MDQAVNYPQCRVVPMRMLKPETSRKLLDILVAIPGVRRILLHGQNIPRFITYGPARGELNKNSMRQNIEVAGNPVDLHIQVGTITLELDNADIVQNIRSTCEEFFVDFPCHIQEGKFMKTQPTLVDYAKYGPSPKGEIIGLVDPKRKEDPSMICLSEGRSCGGGI